MAKKQLTLEEKLEEAIVEDGPYEVPRNWVWVKLESIIKVSSGKGLTAKQMDNTSDIPVYGGNGFVGYHNEFIFESPQVIIGRVGANCGNVHITDDKCWVTDNALVVSYNVELVNTKFLYYLLKINELGKYSNSSAQPVISGAKIYSIKIQLPPLKEQQRIVDRIEGLFEKLDKAKELIEEAREGFEKRKSAVLEMAFRGELTPKCIYKQEISEADKKQLSSDFINFDIPYEISNRWQWVRFNECCTYLGSGSTPKGGREIYQTDGIPFIRSQNVLHGEMDLGEIVYISKEIHEKMKRTKVYPGDTLLNITGASIGRSAMVKQDDIEEANVNQHVCIFRFKNYILDRYPSYWFNSPIFQDIISKQQIGVTREALNFKQLRGMWIPIPPVKEQKEIINILDKLLEEESKIEELTQLEDQIELIKKSILAKAFRGELGTNSEEDESALELLKEILSTI